jgi:hypothetical protein
VGAVHLAGHRHAQTRVPAKRLKEQRGVMAITAVLVIAALVMAVVTSAVHPKSEAAAPHRQQRPEIASAPGGVSADGCAHGHDRHAGAVLLARGGPPSNAAPRRQPRRRS